MPNRNLLAGTWAVLLLVTALLPANSFATSDEVVYADSLNTPWADWSWGTQNLANTSPVHSGTYSISKLVNNYEGLYLHRNVLLSTSTYTNLTFWMHGGTTGGQHLSLSIQLNSTPVLTVTLQPPPANMWTRYEVPFTALGAANFNEIIFQAGAANEGNVYLDDIVLQAGVVPPPVSTPITVPVDVLQNRHPISPYIYGVAYAGSNDLKALNAPVNRLGGNASTRYNWQLNTANRGADWFFMNIAESSAVPGDYADEFVRQSNAGGAEAMVTIPMIEWMPKTRTKTWSYSVAKYGPQTATEATATGGASWAIADAGNGISSTNGARPITWNDPKDANYLTNSLFQQAWVAHLTNQWGRATNGGVRWYIMDNEPSLWFSTHQDVHPTGAKMAEIRDKFFDYAEKVKAVDPGARIAAFEEWGWMGYFYSGYDQQNSGLTDRAANGGMDYLPWLLQQARQRELATGRRLLDLFTVHIYPQSGEYSGNLDLATRQLRNRSTRQLWDTNYVDQSWIGDTVRLIPRLKAWVNTYYPGLPIGITEYSWSQGAADNDMNGATAQADILGIFGREGLDVATRWTVPATDTPTFRAMQLFRNYDGAKSGFGDTSVSAAAPDPDTISVFAALRSSDSALTIVAINKQDSLSTQAGFQLTNFIPRSPAQVWQITSTNAITRLPDLAFSGATVSNTLPAQSITLFVIPAGTRPVLRSSGVIAGSMYNMWLDGDAGQRYVLLSSTNLVEWTPVQTNTLSSPSKLLSVPVAGKGCLFRAQWIP